MPTDLLYTAIGMKDYVRLSMSDRSGVISLAMQAPESAVKCPGCKSSDVIRRGTVDNDLNRLRSEYVQNMLRQEKGELTALEHDAVESLREHDILSQNVNSSVDDKWTFGQRLADHVASFGGSWRFIIIFASVLVVWILTNTLLIGDKPFDPFPFILLNLVLSCLAAIQAPIIMMGQNRVEAKDRLTAKNDYRVNLKAELEIQHLHSKIDLLLTHQWQRLLEIQQVQTDLLEELGNR